MSSSATYVFPSVQGDQVPVGSRPILEKVQKGFGFVPNLFAAFANSPTLLEGYLALEAIYSKGTLSPAERQLVLLTASVVNECGYCTAAHSTIAKGMLKVPAAVVAAVRAGQPVADAKLNALVNLTRESRAEPGSRCSRDNPVVPEGRVPERADRRSAHRGRPQDH